MTKLKPIHAQILGITIVELLNGELTDQTIAAVDSLKREDVPEVLSELVGMIHGMSTLPQLREGIITMLVREIYGISKEALEKRPDA